VKARQSAAILVINADGTGQRQLITDTDGPEVAPDCSPEESKIAYMCRPTGAGSVEICVVDRNGNNRSTRSRFGV
jgi:Tol biopolymer transport system component